MIFLDGHSITPQSWPIFRIAGEEKMSQKLNLRQYGEARFIFSKPCFECVFLKKHAVDQEPQLI